MYCLHSLVEETDRCLASHLTNDSQVDF